MISVGDMVKIKADGEYGECTCEYCEELLEGYGVVQSIGDTEDRYCLIHIHNKYNKLIYTNPSQYRLSGIELASPKTPDWEI